MLLALGAALSTGCHRGRPHVASTPLPSPSYEHCWWAAYRTAMSPDSVAARYAGAYKTLGFPNGGWSHLGDTAWAEAGPTALAREAGTRVYAARVVAIRRGDTTFFRQFNAVQLQPADSGGKGALAIPFCLDMNRVAMTGGIAPRDEEPDDTMPLWRRRPTH
jgi:hypothetical protein